MDAMNTLFSQSESSLLGTTSPAMSSFAKQQQQTVSVPGGGPSAGPGPGPGPGPPPAAAGMDDPLRKTGGAGGGVLHEPFYIMRELPGDGARANGRARVWALGQSDDAALSAGPMGAWRGWGARL
ncbi:hypothetical protein chiPu_0025615 [Chiloscyllium punctatum]|uniref:Uncharacterized protein n=1 Tax=Chiloscyllium punctatum TaxID=137246 RepID=A0A401TH13_CHIPU|nr:hypothetical protein [Chiloscyllium punctatum]